MTFPKGRGRGGEGLLLGISCVACVLPSLWPVNLLYPCGQKDQVKIRSIETRHLWKSNPCPATRGQLW